MKITQLSKKVSQRVHALIVTCPYINHRN